MFADDIALVAEMVAKYGAKPPFVDVGGLEKPCIADYSLTIDAMELLGGISPKHSDEDVIAAQQARYLDVFRPLEASCPGYVCENPETGGLLVEDLRQKFDGSIGTAILLSVLEHVDDPLRAVRRLRFAMARGGLVIISVPFTFPYHPESGQDCWRFTPTGLGKLFERSPGWTVLEADWRLDIPAEAGVIDLKTGRAQIIKSAYLVARAC